MNFRKKYKERAFSLVEILVTLGILLVLSALAFMAYRLAIGTAQGAKNLANHRTIARGLLAYAQEHNGSLPYLTDYDPPFDVGTSYSAYAKTLVILGYVSDPRVFFSPRFWPRWGGVSKETALQVIADPEKYLSNVIPWAYSNYGVNRYGAMPAWNDLRQPANLNRVAGDGNLSRLMLTRDTYYADYDKAPNMLRGGGVDWFAADDRLPEERDCYAGIVHASFADGHVEGHRRRKMVEMMQAGAMEPLFKNVYTLP